MAIKDVLNYLKRGTVKAIDKIDDTVEVQKLKYRISKKEEELDEVCLTLGRTVIEKEVLGEAYATDLAKAVEDVKKLTEEIALLEEECRKLRKVVVCPNCHAEVSVKTAFCGKCGAKNESYKDAAPYEEKSVEGDASAEETTE